MISEDVKSRIDNMSYREMLSLWRFSPSGHHYFQGAVGVYFSQVMAEKHRTLPEGEHSKISKEIGWNN